MRTLLYKIYVSIRWLFQWLGLMGWAERSLPIMRATKWMRERIAGGNIVIITESTCGNRMYVNPYYVDLIKGRGYHQGTTKLFTDFIESGMTVVDVGANIGYFTLLAARLVGEKGKVFAFEPEPENYALLTKNIEINDYKNVTAMQKAASNKTGQVELFLDKVQTTTHTILRVRGETCEESIAVDAVSLDEFFKGKERLIDVIKIDVEGAEMLVLLGMTKILKSNDNLKVFTEFWPQGLEKAGFSPEEYVNKLVQSGFEYIYLIDELGQPLEKVDFEAIIRHCKRSLLKQSLSVNLLCTKVPLQ